ncbi:YciI family protein [Methyloligella sp. 2.7D]|uniref:YciI family protein n=1 Tax=unclassified Methyloligella TaxID=2625955 RepID=UPI00157DD7D3|nr:YciI family protein [Methyloligella sp. GL2]QKP76185.1 YciI family protein [Methyloligella sp. GL2]
MYYALICTDKPGSLALRKEKRPEHAAHLQSLGDTLIFAGPFTEEDGESMNGSLVVVEAASMEEAKALSEQDPFFKYGVFETIEIRPWKWTMKKPGA